MRAIPDTTGPNTAEKIPPNLLEKTREGTQSSDFLVKFEKEDGDNPMEFSPYLKAWLTLEMGLLALTGTVGSSIITPAETNIAAYLSTSKEVTVLALSLFLLGMSSPIRQR